VLLVRGSTSTEVVNGVVPEYLEGAKKLVDEEQRQAFEVRVREMYEQMAMITIAPEWAKVLDFKTRIPDILTRLIEERNL